MAYAARLNLRMQKELKLLLTDPPPGVSLGPISDNDSSSSSSSLSCIEARIEGPEGTVYSKGVFSIRIQVPERYPFQPPNVTFMTPIYHPNIDSGGRICLDILNLPPKGAWQPSLNISTVLASIGLLLSEPNPDDGLMCETSREYKYNRHIFDQKARSWTEKYAKARAGRDSNESGILLNSSLVVEAERANTKSEDLVHENEHSRKKCRIISEKLALKPMAPVERCDSDDKENVPPTRRLSLSCSQNLLSGETKSVVHQHVVPYDEQDSQQDCNNQATNGSQEKLDPGSKITETVIVSDSEESEEEGDRPTRSRLSFMRKRIAGKRKVEGYY